MPPHSGMGGTVVIDNPGMSVYNAGELTTCGKYVADLQLPSILLAGIDWALQRQMHVYRQEFHPAISLRICGKTCPSERYPCRFRSGPESAFALLRQRQQNKNNSPQVTSIGSGVPNDRW